MQAGPTAHHFLRSAAARDQGTEPTLAVAMRPRLREGLGGKASILMPGKHELIPRQF